ncbi:type I polyketide synthase, partial [Streptomyces sp. NPDC055078]
MEDSRGDNGRRTGEEPVAVIGMGCRLPGGIDTPDGLWELLCAGGHTTGPIPEERWRAYRESGPGLAGLLRRTTGSGSFLADVGDFDAEFFGLSPREAELMDPQHRLLLEVSWQALEDAGVPPHTLAGSDTGVFTGIGSDDYGRRLLEDLPRVEAWTAIGAAYCAAANRVSYALDLRGPSIALDTACSSSLAAVHLACQSLRRREGDLALAGGVNLVIAPGMTASLDAAGATSPDGRCKPFDAAADGYGRGEGCGVLVLKRLADARRDGDRVLAVVLGSAVHQDGRTNGIMAPSGEAQRHLLARACRAADIEPGTVDYVEAHGTGTPTGDPVEAGALAGVYGAGRPPGRPCLVGSVKANVGHLEAGAGVIGVIKTVLALGRRHIPPTPVFAGPDPAVDWAASGLRLVSEQLPWPRGTHPPRAGVSGFGYGGTIAHVLLERAPAVPGTGADAPAPDAGAVFPLSAAAPEGLRACAGRLADWLEGPGRGEPLAGVGHTLALRRSHLDHRAAIVAADRTALVAGLRHCAAGDDVPELTAGPVLPGAGRGAVWVFSGHGAQWAGMGRELLAGDAVFAAVIDELAVPFGQGIGCTPRELIEGDDLTRVDRVQTLTYAVQVALAAVWTSYGLRPAAVIGHSVGEIAAAVTAGVLSREDGARLVCGRSRLLRRVAGQGAMAMVALPFAETARRLAARPGVVAAIDASPVSSVVSGSPEAVREITAELTSAGVVVRPVAADVAFHSAQMDPLLDEMAAAAGPLRPAPPAVPLYTTALSDPQADVPRDGAYWAANLRNPVLFTPAVRAAAGAGHRVFLEVSSHPVVAHSVGEVLRADGVDGTVLPTLLRGRPERATLLGHLGGLHCAGVPVDWARLQPTAGLVTLPPMAWQRLRHWREPEPGASAGSARHDSGGHCLLGPRLSIGGPVASEVWNTTLTGENRPYPGNHTIHGVEIMPASVLLRTLLDAADGGGPERDSADRSGPGRDGADDRASERVLTDVELRLPLRVGAARDVQVTHTDGVLRIAYRAAGPDVPPDGPWQSHATAAAGSADGPPPGAPFPAGRDLAPVPPETVFEGLAAAGVPTMAYPWRIDGLRRGGGELAADIEIPPAERVSWAPVLDAVLSVAPSLLPEPGELRMVATVGALTVRGRPPARPAVRLRLRATESGPRVDALVQDESGRTVATLSGVGYAAMDGRAARTADPSELTYLTTWRAAGRGQQTPVRRVTLLGGGGPLRD